MNAVRQASKWAAKATRGLAVITVFLLGLLSLGDPAHAAKLPRAHHAVVAAAPAKAPKLDARTEAKAKAKAEPKVESKAEASPGVAMDPAVKKLVDAMQAFYEKTNDFSARFDQSYKYASFNRTQQSSGTVVFRKPKKLAKGELEAPAMRWDYEKPEQKSIVVTGGLVYMYQPEAKQLTKAAFNASSLSASVTFLWGVGKLADEFYITKVDRPDLTRDGTALQLVPKKQDPRFDRVFMVVDPKTHEVAQTVVVDPDGSTNHMTFSGVKTDQNIPNDRFSLNPPPDTQVIDMTKAPQK